jgi:hypothetical protein
MWHPDFMTKEEAMTELLAALADTSLDAEEQRARRIAAAFYAAWQADQSYGWQKRLAARTGVSRETVRRNIEDERIRRGEIGPTPRYLAEQEKRARQRAARES